jgi:hypothetical protein
VVSVDTMDAMVSIDAVDTVDSDLKNNKIITFSITFATS